jgi:acetyl/propionyl-CoA carboxylase alpha subunit
MDFDSVLVANRGEIARRVFRSCRDLGLTTVAVFSDPDADSPFVAEADRAVRLPGASPAETYLQGEAIVRAALRAGAQAVHPGYGFLSENADFARAVQAAGLIWIGPPPRAIELMGSKIEAKRLMAEAGVPVLAELKPADVGERDLPVLIKASAGGGGRGMRVVTNLAALDAQLTAAAGEAERAFGDPAVFCERYLATGRHLEVQVLADQYGTVWAVGERECSIQRRHQKVIEEAPAPLADRVAGLRERLRQAAIAATRAVDYTGAGTVEFISDQQGNFYFLEMNTRLQVEHPVTEATTGLDLVRAQLQIAAGRQLAEQPPPSRGHAIEARLYAEDPAQDWLPQSGALHLIEFDQQVSKFRGPGHIGLRLDSGVENGSRIGVHYDPMLAKVICFGEDRRQVARTLAGALARARLHGPVTNRDLLVRVLRDPAFLDGELATDFLDRPELREPLADQRAEWLSTVAAALAAATDKAGSGLPRGWRNVYSQPQRRGYRGRHGEHQVDYRITRAGTSIEGHGELAVITTRPDAVVLEIGGVRHSFSVASYGRTVYVDSDLGPVRLTELERFTDPATAAPAGSLLAPMPGAIVRVGVDVGEQVQQGRPLLWIEAMKMEHPIAAPAAGKVVELAVGIGDQVGQDDVLVVLELGQP